jgi:hypothetical protein
LSCNTNDRFYSLDGLLALLRAFHGNSRNLRQPCDNLIVILDPARSCRDMLNHTAEILRGYNQAADQAHCLTR